jgi:co-chaperonin GroES (HSP10)
MVLKLVKPLNLRPTQNYFIGEPQYEKETAAGLVLPDHVAKNEDNAPIKVKVLAVGPGQYSMHTGVTRPCYVKPGDVVYTLGPRAQLVLGGRELWVQPDDCVACVVEPELKPEDVVAYHE